MMHTDQALYDELRQTLSDIDMQIKHIKNDIAIQYPEEKRPKLNVWFWTRNVDGTYVLSDMLSARAQVLSAMANIKVASRPVRR